MSVRVMLVTPESPLTGGGGIATYIAHASRAHIEAGNEVLIVTYTIDGPQRISPSAWSKNLHLAAENLHLIPLTSEELNQDKAYGWEMRVARAVSREVEKLISEWRPHVVEGTDYCFPLLPLMQKARAGLVDQAPLFITFHHGLQEDIWVAAGVVYGTEAQKLFAGELNALRFADIVLAPSEVARQNIIGKGIAPHKVHLVREPFYSTRSSRKTSGASRNFVYFGRVAFAKGVDRAVRFFNFAFQENDSAKLHLLGPFAPLPFRKDHPQDFVCKAAKDAGAFSFSNQKFDRDMLPELLGDHDIFLNFSRSETFSYTTAEAVFLGMKVLCDRNSAAAELLPADVRERLPQDWETEPAAALESIAALDELDIARIQAFMEDTLSPVLFADRYTEVCEAAKEAVASKRAGLAPRPWGAPNLISLEEGNERPLVSFLIATYNDATFLMEALESIYAQTIHDYEIVIYNDGSTDELSERLYSGIKNFPKVKFLQGVNIGLVGARNVLIGKACGTYSVFLDADDRICPDFLKKSLHAFEHCHHLIDAVIPWRQNFDQSNELVCDYLLHTYFHKCLNDFRMTALIKTRVLRQLKFSPNLVHGEGDDWDFWLRFSLAGFEAIPLPEPLFEYRVSPGSMSHPWSQGQAALTADLLARTLGEAAGSTHQINGKSLAHMMRMNYSYRYFSGR